MRLRVLGSGSSGNCLAVRTACGSVLLVDCGLTCRETRRRLAACGVDPADVRGVFFTHDHSDHCAGAAAFRRQFPLVPFYANEGTADAIATHTGVEDGWRVFGNGDAFPFEGARVTAFSVPHDAADPVGYLIREGDSALFVCTDLGEPTYGVRDALAAATCAVLEFNHDPVLLETSRRAPSLKRRIAGRSGHLSNGQAADLLRDAAPARLRALLLAHVSGECNEPSRAVAEARSALGEIGLPSVTLAALAADSPSDLYEF